MTYVLRRHKANVTFANIRKELYDSLFVRVICLACSIFYAPF